MSMVERYDAHIAAAEEAGNVLGAQLLKGQRDIFNAARDAGVVTELPMAVALTSESKRRPAKTPEKRLQDAVEAYKSEPITPKSVNGLWVAQGEVWESGLLAAGERVSLTIPRFSGSQEELTQAVEKGDRVIVVPDELSTQENRHRLGLLYPSMGSFSVQRGNPVRNSYDQKGYLYTEAKTDAPYLGTTEEQLERHLTRTGRRGLTLNAYIIGSQTNKMLNGTYFDQGSTWSRVLGSRDEDRVVDARFNPDGYLYVGSNLRPGYRSPHLGGRSEGVKKA